MPIIPKITGIGLITALGRSADATFTAILKGEHITTHTRLDTKEPRVISLATEVTDQAMANANWSGDRADTAVVACTSKGSVESWMTTTEPGRAAPDRVQDRAGTARLSFGLSDLSSHLANHIGSTGPRLCLSAACASGLHGLIRAAMLIQSGEVDRALVVAAEASVHPLFLASFNRLGVLPPPGELCRPFDQNRSGFLMSEAAAAICLEASNDSSHVLATVQNYALGGDATHLTGSDPSGVVLQHLLKKVLEDNPRLDLFQAHGTGTELNDKTELHALDAVLGPSTQPLIFSHKAALGHTLGASGLVAIAIDCLCRQNQIIPGNINTIDPVPTRFRIERTPQPLPANHRSLIHAAGFGGPTAVVVLG